MPPLLLLSAIWGSSYMFIKVGVRDLSPAALVDLRLVLAEVVLLAFVAARGRVRAVRRAVVPGAFVGVVGMALPFLLISWGETRVDSGVAAVATSSVPIFVALLALRFAVSERASTIKGVGLAVGLAGVAVVAGVHPSGGWRPVVGTLAVVLAALCYAVSSLFSQRNLATVGGVELATASVGAGAVAMLPFALARLPNAVGVEVARFRDRPRRRGHRDCVADRQPADRRARRRTRDARQLPPAGLRARLRRGDPGRAPDACEGRWPRAHLVGVTLASGLVALPARRDVSADLVGGKAEP